MKSMNKSEKCVKLLPVWLAVSAVVILAGIILWALLGFNYAAEKPTHKTFEVNYDVVVELGKEGETDPAKLDELCMKAFEDAKIKPESAYTDDSRYTLGYMLRYTFSADTSDEALAAAKTAVEAAIKTTFPAHADLAVSYHTLKNQGLSTADWRGAVAIAVGAVVALIYVCVRFGPAAAITGCVNCVHDTLFALAILVVARIPVSAASPLVIAGIAAFASIILWLVFCALMRGDRKNPANAAVSALEAVTGAQKSAVKPILIIAGGAALVLLLVGLVAAPGVRLFTLPALLSVAAAAYSSLLLGPALHVHVKRPFDKLFSKQKRYVGKKKAENAEN